MYNWYGCRGTGTFYMRASRALNSGISTGTDAGVAASLFEFQSRLLLLLNAEAIRKKIDFLILRNDFWNSQHLFSFLVQPSPTQKTEPLHLSFYLFTEHDVNY